VFTAGFAWFFSARRENAVPDFEYSPHDGKDRRDEIQNILQQIERRFGKRGVLWLILAAVILIVVISALAGSFYAVGVQENAVILRFGKYREGAGVIGPGLHMKIPFIDRVYKAKVEEIKKEEFGYRTVRPGIESRFEVQPSLMLSGDLNVANVRWVVRYKIDNLPDYVFNVRDVGAAVRDVSDAVMRRVVGDYSVDEALTIGRQEIQVSAQEQMQRLLDEYKVGIKIIAVRLQESTPPEEVRDAFNEVNQALQEKDRTIQEAEGERNKRIPAARGLKLRAIAEAEGYKINKTNRATGDVKEFEAVLERYLLAKEITRRRLYLETMAKVLSKAGRKYVIEGDQGVLKLLPLEFGPALKGGGQ